MSMILKPSMSRMRTIVVDTGSSAGIVMCRNDCQRLAPSTRAASWTSWSRPSMAASRTMNTNGVHCHVSPMITAGAGEPRVGDPGEVPQAELDPQRLERALRRVGHHQEHVADADRRDRQRDQEHDPEELAPRHLLDGQQREAEAERVLERDPDEHEDQGDDQRARAAAVAQQRLHEQVDEADEQDPGEQAQHEPERARPCRRGRPAVQATVTSAIVVPTTSQPSRIRAA